LEEKNLLIHKLIGNIVYRRIKECDAKSIIEKNLSKLESSGTFKNRFIVIFGANWYAEFVMNYFNQHNIRIDAVIDNSDKKCGNYLGSVKITKPEDVMLEYKENALVIIATRFASEMIEQLKGMSYSKRKHVYVIKGLFTDERKRLKMQLFDMLIAKLKMSKGYYVYEKLVRKYGENTTFLVIPVRGTGDVYIVCAHLRKYLYEKKINNYVLLLPTISGRKIASCFGFEQTEVIPISEIVFLKDFAGFVGYENLNVKMMHWAQTKNDGIVSENFPFSDDLTMVDVYRKTVFDDIFIREKMKRELNEPVINEIFQKNGILENKTVIISPYAQTFMGLPLKTWDNIIIRLKKAGYQVCTNTGTKEEKPLPGTIPLYIDYKTIIQVVEKAGYFIGIRSGLSDILSEADYKKIIIYPKCINMENTRKFFSIVNSGLDRRAIEIEYNNEDDFEERVVGLIVN